MNGSPSIFREVVHLKSPLEQLPELLKAELEETEAPILLWTARRPHKRWHTNLVDWTPLLLTTAPQHEQIAWMRPELEVSIAHPFQEECRRLLDDYEALFDGTLPPGECPHFAKYRELLMSHIRRQEQSTFPNLLRQLPLQRALRELGYEHQGLERGLKSLEHALEKSRNGTLNKAEKERIDLDFYHLLEHHIERERDALSPIVDFLEGVYRRGSTCYNPPHPSRSDVAQR